MAKSFKIFVILLFFSSCSSPKYFYYIEYENECVKCGKTRDAYLTFSVPKNVGKRNPFYVLIKNNTTETIIIDQRYCAITEEGTLIEYPIGFVDPFTSFTNSSLVGYTEYHNYLLFKSGDYSNVVTSYAAQGVSQGWDKTRPDVTNVQKMNSKTVEPKPYLIIPGNTKIRFRIKDQTQRKYFYMINHYIDKYGDTDWREVEKRIKNLEGDEYVINFVYRKINDESWNEASLIYKSTNLRINENDESESLELMEDGL